jgi:hypothetical protein
VDLVIQTANHNVLIGRNRAHLAISTLLTVEETVAHRLRLYRSQNDTDAASIARYSSTLL